MLCLLGTVPHCNDRVNIMNNALLVRYLEWWLFMELWGLEALVHETDAYV